MAIIASFPSLGGGRMVIPDYGGVAGTGPATFLNFPITVSDKKPAADGEREGAIWIQTKNLLGEITSIKITEAIPTGDSEDNTLYFVVSNMRNLKMDVIQETGVWKPIEMHLSIGIDHRWLVGSLDDGSKLYLNLPLVYSKLSGVVSIENAWYYHDGEWLIISEVGRIFFKGNLSLTLLSTGKYIKNALPFANTDYTVNHTGDYLTLLSMDKSNANYYAPSASFSIYKKVVNTFEKISDNILLSDFGFENISVPTNMVMNDNGNLLAIGRIYFVQKSNATFFLLILEKNGDSYSVIKEKTLYHMTFSVIHSPSSLNNIELVSKLSCNSSFNLFAIVFDPIYYLNNMILYIPIFIVFYNDGDLNEIYREIVTINNIAGSNVPTYYAEMYTRVFDDSLLAIPTFENNMIKHKLILFDGETIVDTYVIPERVYIKNATYERIGKYGIVTYATKDTTETGNYIMGLSYDRETLQFVSTGVSVRTADQIYDPVDEMFPGREYLSHYSIQKDEALFTINGVTLLKGGEAGANFDLETGVITAATTMMDQGVKVYEDTVSRTGGPNIYI